MQQVFVAGADWLQNLPIILATVFGYIREWQFQIASLLILLSGAIFIKAISFIKAINRQIKLQEFKSEDRRQRLGRVYRASMPEDLDAICSYAIRSSEVMREAALIVDATEAGTHSPA